MACIDLGEGATCLNLREGLQQHAVDILSVPVLLASRVAFKVGGWEGEGVVANLELLRLARDHCTHHLVAAETVAVPVGVGLPRVDFRGHPERGQVRAAD